MAVPVELTVTAEKKYLFLPVKHGMVKRRLVVTVDGEPVRRFDIELATGEDEADFFAPLEIACWRGAQLTLSTDDEGGDAPGLSGLTQGDSLKGASDLYRESCRPQCHFTSRRGWLNDPNGLVYYEGEYHLFYQHNPYGCQWGNMHWGHAISNDLLHWREQGDKLFPDAMGTIFSGSALVDWDNIGGFQTGPAPALVTCYTAAGSQAKPEVPFTQCLAFSNDRGRTWTKFSGNPVVPEMAAGNRDPKVFWHQKSGQWVMPLFLDSDPDYQNNGRQRYTILVSRDMKVWRRGCELTLPGSGECPDFFELPVDGKAADTRWVFWGADGHYLLGGFDGTTFTPESEPLSAYCGGSPQRGSAYAAQTYSDIPAADGRRIQIAWLQGDLPGMPFNQQMAFPTELSLQTTADGIRLCSRPIREIEKLHQDAASWQSRLCREVADELSSIDGELLHIQASFRLSPESVLKMTIHGTRLVYDAGEGSLTVGDLTAPCPVDDGQLRLEMIVDRASLEVFALDGRVSIPLRVLAGERGLTLESRGTEDRVESLHIHRLASIWEPSNAQP